MPHETRRLIPIRTLPLLARLEPLPKELFRSFIARTARASCTSYLQLVKELGVQVKGGKVPSWFGVQLSRTESEIVGILLRHNPETILTMQLPVDRSLSPDDVKHPTRYRACAECQLEDGGWRRSNGDPLRVACRIHNTLLHNEGPEQQRLSGDAVFNNAHSWDWETLTQESPAGIEALVELQTELSNARYDHPEIDADFTRLIVAYRRALEREPEAEVLHDWCAEGWDILEEAGRPRADFEQRDRSFKSESIWTRTEELVAIFPTAVPAVIAAAKGDSYTYEHMYDDLFSLGLNKSIDTYSAMNSTSGVIIGRPMPVL